MFERATAFSAVLIFLIFGIVGLKYLDFLETKTQSVSTAVTNSP